MPRRVVHLFPRVRIHRRTLRNRWPDPISGFDHTRVGVNVASRRGMVPRSGRPSIISLSLPFPLVTRGLPLPGARMYLAVPPIQSLRTLDRLAACVCTI